jgi:hypothetical protein
VRKAWTGKPGETPPVMVVLIVNHDSKTTATPPEVVYQDQHGRLWSHLVAEWENDWAPVP